MLNSNQFIDQLTNSSEKLRLSLEGFLEGDSAFTDKNIIKEHIQVILELFKEHEFSKAVEACQLCEKIVDDINPNNDTENEAILLRLCLLLSRMIEDESLDLPPNDQLFHHFVKEIHESLAQQSNQPQSIQINTKLLKVLRTLYQRQLLRLIKDKKTNSALRALAGVCEEIQLELPLQFQPEWKALTYYVDNLYKNDGLVTPKVHRLLGILDHRFSLISQPNQGIYNNVHPDLLKAIESTDAGLAWIKEHIPAAEAKIELSAISAATYSRFVLAIKDPLLKLHEGFELLAIHSGKKDFLVNSLEFLNNLTAILTLMNKPRLANLSSNIALFVVKITEKDITEEAELLDTVMQLWVLEQFISALWKIEDGLVPISQEEMVKWALTRSINSTYLVLAEEYSTLRSQLESITGMFIDDATKIMILKVLNAEQTVGLTTNLTRLFLNQMNKSEPQDKGICLEVILALEYSARRCSEAKEVSNTVINQAVTSLEKYIMTQKEAAQELESSSDNPKISETKPVADKSIAAERIYHPQLQSIIQRVAAICASWEAIGEDDICRAALYKYINELCDLCISLGLESAARLSYEWCYWLGHANSEVALNHTVQLKDMIQKVAKHIEQDVDASDLIPYFQFVNATYGSINSADIDSKALVNTPIFKEAAPVIQQDQVVPAQFEIDPDVIEALIGEIEDLAAIAVSVFEKGLINAEDMISLERVAHTLRGSASIINSQDAISLAGKLEKQCITLNEADYLLSCQLASDFGTVFTELSKLTGVAKIIQFTVKKEHPVIEAPTIGAVFGQRSLSDVLRSVREVQALNMAAQKK